MEQLPRIEERDGCIRFTVHVQPRASRSAITGMHGDAVKVRLTAPPVDGAANAALVAFLADVLSVTRSTVRVVAGEKSRSKVVEVVGVERGDIYRLVRSVSSR
jgi:hypothetical protein